MQIKEKMESIIINIRNKRKYFLILLLYLLLFIFAYRSLLDKPMMVFGDNDPFPETANQAFESFFSAWQPMSHGVTAVKSLVLFYKGVILVILSNNAILAQKIFYLSPMAIACLSMFLFLNGFIKSDTAKFIASFAYGVNPVTIGDFLGGGPNLWFVALFPFLLKYAIKALECQRSNNTYIYIFSLLFAFLYSLYAYTLILVPFFVTILFLISLLKNTPYLIFKQISIIAFMFVISGIIAFMLTLPFTYHWLGFATQFTTESIAKEGIINSLVSDVMNTFSQSGMLNSLRLGSVNCTLGYCQFSNWTITGLILPILAYLALLFKYDKKYKYVLDFSLIFIILIMFIWLIHTGLLIPYLKKFPFIFSVTRNPTISLLLLSVPLSFLIANSIEKLEKKIKSNFTSKCLVLILFVVILIYNWPFLMGDMGLSQARGTTPELSEYFIPERFFTIGEWIQNRRETEGFFRTLWLPWGYEDPEIKVRWIDPYTVSIPFGADQYGIPGIDYVMNLYNEIATGNRNISLLLYQSGIKYIIVDKKSKQTGRIRVHASNLLGDPNNFIKFLSTQQDLYQVYDGSNFTIYENHRFLPIVKIYNSAIYIPKSIKSNSSVLDEYEKFSGKNNLGDQMIIFESLLSTQQKKDIIKKLYVQNNNSDNFTEVSYTIIKMRPDEYNIQVKTEKPIFIEFNELYHPQWEVYINNEKLIHFPTLFGNGFYSDRTGEFTLKIVYKMQKDKDTLVRIWAVFSIFIIMLTIYIILKSKKEPK